MSRLAKSPGIVSGMYSLKQLNRDSLPSSFGVQSTSALSNSANARSSLLTFLIQGKDTHCTPS